MRNPTFRSAAITALLLSGMLPAGAQSMAAPTIHIATDKITAKMSPVLYGLMTEEINFSYEGGLYGELIRNRTFKGEAGFSYNAEEPVYWSPVGHARIALDKDKPLNNALNLSLLLDASEASTETPAGISNPGYWGIPVKPNATYTVSFYAKADGKAGPFAVALAKAGGTVIASATVRGVTAEWKKFETKLKTGNVSPSKDNIFTLTTTAPGKIWLQQVSLFGDTYNGRPNGNRRDLMEMMSALKPAFLRLPGGNYLEGDTFSQRFDWTKTIGDTAQRPGHRSPWNYWSTDGMGLLEYLEWCEDLKVEPVLAVFAGYALQGEHVSSPEELAPLVQDALDEIEYVSGDATTKWGAQRARDGHPKPFVLHYVEIGNEDFFDRAGTYDRRFSAFYKAIKAKYPHLQLISTMPASATPSQHPDVVDEHNYAWNEGQMYDHVNDYDNRSRSEPKVFVGEWATHEGWPMPNMKAALADAAYLTGLERNSDHVVMSAYAPLLANVSHVGGVSRENSMQWAIDLIGYDALQSYGTPSYYVQKMFAQYKGDVVLAATGDGIPTWTLNDKVRPSLYWVVTRQEESGHIQIKLVNRGGPVPLHLVLSGVKHIAPVGSFTVLQCDDLEGVNSLAAPDHIVPKTEKMTGLASDFTLKVPAYSVSVLDFAAQ